MDGKTEQVEMHTSLSGRMQGLLFREPDSLLHLLVPCHDVHTFGMKHPLDIAFIAHDGHVLEVHRNVAARKRIKRKGAAMVAERFARSDSWLKAGDIVQVGVPYE